jgi:hypothetical protein
LPGSWSLCADCSIDGDAARVQPTDRLIPARRECDPGHERPSEFGASSQTEALLAHLKAKQAGAVGEQKPTFAAPRRVII